ncbi:MAG: hypothetical protein A2Y95_09150 [Deltaproteobacteria bacterium RBG_13_65_10]|nr:MAG: hypothetical protein A2Y95_09150 [Deltaproteobacteria bacterium RBG_13_65_10]
MGATLPLLADFLRRGAGDSRAWRVGILYASNTFGAALGSLAAGFVLIESIGVRGTSEAAVLMNLLVALWAFTAARRSKALPDVPREEAVKPWVPGARIALALAGAGGALALASEVLWTRTLEILMGNSTYAFDLILLVYLLGLACGGACVSWAVKRTERLFLALVTIQIATGLCVLLAVGAFDALGAWFGRHTFQVIPPGAILLDYLAIAALLLPMALVTGATFPVVTRILDPDAQEASGTKVARVYAWNTVGAVLGSLLAGLVIAPRMDYFQSIELLAALYALIGLVAILTLVFRGIWRRRSPAAWGVGALAAGVGTLALVFASGDSQYLKHLEGRGGATHVVFHKPGRQGVTTVISDSLEKGSATILMINGAGMTRKAVATKMMAHLPLLLHPAPRKTLIIGFGMGTTYRSAISHGGKVTVVELVSEVFEAFDWFFADAERVRRYPRGRMVVNDGRNFLALSKERFDVITIDPPPPINAAGVTHLYSKEFLELARAHLNEGGIMAHWIPLPGSLAGVDDRETFMGLLETFHQVFSHTLMIRGIPPMGLHVLGSSRPIAVSDRRLRERLRRPAVAADLNEWGNVPVNYFSHLSFYRAPDVPLEPLTDDRPYLEFDLLRSLRSGTAKVYPLVVW